jgi:hypothetical protein
MRLRNVFINAEFLRLVPTLRDGGVRGWQGRRGGERWHGAFGERVFDFLLLCLLAGVSLEQAVHGVELVARGLDQARAGQGVEGPAPVPA